jgi:type IV secretory pathway TrbL component
MKNEKCHKRTIEQELTILLIACLLVALFSFGIGYETGFKSAVKLGVNFAKAVGINLEVQNTDKFAEAIYLYKGHIENFINGSEYGLQ